MGTGCMFGFNCYHYSSIIDPLGLDPPSPAGAYSSPILPPTPNPPPKPSNPPLYQALQSCTSDKSLNTVEYTVLVSHSPSSSSTGPPTGAPVGAGACGCGVRVSVTGLA